MADTDEKVRRHRRALERAAAAVADGTQRARNSPHRPAYHFAPPAGWMNDPNGLVQFRGDYHLFYQHHPYSAEWGQMHWGHAVSTDLVRWRHLPVALAPSDPWETEGVGGCWSGSAVVDDDTLTLIYTGHADDHDPVEVQCIATSSNGLTFEKHPGNPVVTGPPRPDPAGFRDPRVWRHGDAWYMVVGSGWEGRARALLYRSADLRKWQHLGAAAEAGPGHGFMWECPDLFPLEDRYVLICSPMGYSRQTTVAFVGRMDYQAGRFEGSYAADCDWGPDFYAAQTFRDDAARRIMFGWAGGPGRDVTEIPDGWAGCLSTPRLVSFTTDGALCFLPVPELETLRGQQTTLPNLQLLPGQVQPVPGVHGDALDLQVALHAGDRGVCGLSLRRSDDGREETRITYDAGRRVVALDRDRSGSGAAGVYTVPLDAGPDGTVDLRILVDRSLVEVFARGGRAALTARVYPAPDSLGVAVFCEKGPAAVRSLDAWQMASVW
jgi:beta-fructofuranosidase